MTDANAGFIDSTQDMRARIAAVAPRYVQASREYLFPEVWDNPTLSKRDRSLITIAIILTKGFEDTLQTHIQFGLANGLTREEIGEMITHSAFYAGFPNAHIAAEAAYKIFAEQDAKASG